MARDNPMQDYQTTAKKLLEQAQQARLQQRFTAAMQFLRRALGLYTRAGSPEQQAMVRALMGRIERDLRHLDAAFSHYRAALKTYEKIGDRDRAAHTIRHLGDLHYDAGRLEAADACYRQALSIYRSNAKTSPLDLANATRSQAVLQTRLGAVEKARRLWREAGRLYEAAKVPAGVTECQQQLAGLDGSPDQL